MQLQYRHSNINHSNGIVFSKFPSLSLIELYKRMKLHRVVIDLNIPNELM